MASQEARYAKSPCSWLRKKPDLALIGELNMANKSPQTDPFTFVRMDEKGPRVRWRRVVTFAGAILLGYFVSQSILYLTLRVPFRLGMVSAVFSVQLAFLATAIELQRQSLKPGKSVFRFDLTYLFVATLLIAIFFASITAEVRASRRGFERNSEIKAQLEDLIRGGNVYLGELGGKRITCEITRRDFSDNDLRELLEAARGTDSGVCEITMLVLEVTAVTDDGLKKLSVCPNLEILALPPIALSDATLEQIASWQNLKFLTLDQKKLTDSQLNLLSVRLPNTKINGMNHKDRQEHNYEK